MSIHPSAIISTSAVVAADVQIGAYAVVGDNVTLGEGCVLEHHAVIKANCRIGKNNHFFQFTSIGEQSQDLKYKGEETWLEIGDDNVFREFCTVNRGTGHDRSLTTIGSNNSFLSYTHIAHDCILGNNIVMSNNATLAGHVYIGDHVVFGGFSSVHQFCNIGNYAMIGAYSWCTQDVPAFVLVAKNGETHPVSINTVGMNRKNFSDKEIATIRECFKLVYRKKLRLEEALAKIEAIITPETEKSIRIFTSSINRSKRGLLR